MPGRQQKFDVQAAWHCKYHVVLIPKCKPSHRTAMDCVMCHVRCRGSVFYVGERRTVASSALRACSSAKTNAPFSGDGYTLAVGAPGDSSEENGDPASISFDSRGSGAVYIFAAEGEVWQRRAFLKARTAPSCDRLGEQVVLSGDGKVLSAWATGLAADAIGRDPKADGLRRNHRAGVTSGCRFTGSGGSSARCRRSNRSASAGPASTRVARHRARLAPADAMDGA